MKLLSGSMFGAEYSLTEGDAVFVFGPMSHVIDDDVAQTIARADNTYYVPDTRLASTLMIRVLENGSIEVGQVEAGELSQSLQVASTNVVVRLRDVSVAFRHDNETWSNEVIAFQGDAAVTSIAPPSRRYRARGVRRCLPGLVLCVFGLALIGWSAAGDRELRRSSPGHAQPVLPGMTLLRGRDGFEYGVVASTDHIAAIQREWTRVAPGRYLTWVGLDVERHRIEAKLERSGYPIVTLRMDNPAVPELVLSGGEAQGNDHPSARQLILDAMPFATDVTVSMITDDALIEAAKRSFVALGIRPGVVRRGATWGVVNDGSLTDMQLNALRSSALEFERNWGARRVIVHVRMQDAVLPSTNFRYRPDMLTQMTDSSLSFMPRDASL
uniref:PrgH/EprH family type III secretion apparatus protein n=1 Tax=Dyella soli TaxID=522319 RepID=UPI0013F3EC56|nr:PrgH/EprH family type III secretion apparatus protein [Dyella soli]